MHQPNRKRRSSRCWVIRRRMAARRCGGSTPMRQRVPRRRARLQGQARGQISLPRLFDAREAQGRLRGRARGQPAVRAGASIAAWSPITREPAGLALGGTGEPVEWAVEMHRFDENATLDRLAEAARSTSRSPMRSAARSRRRMRERRRSRPSRGSTRSARFIGAERGGVSRPPDLFPRGRRRALTRRAARRSSACGRCCAARRARLVRRGHGDLHLGNIALIDGKPVPFDAIEFDPLVAAGDVLYDLAFLLMDLLERGSPRRPIWCSTAIWRKRAATRISTRSPHCRCSCRCAPRSAPR